MNEVKNDESERSEAEQLQPVVMLHEHVLSLVEQHVTYRATARVTGVDIGYLHRMAKGEKLNPSDKVLKMLGLKKEIRYYAI